MWYGSPQLANETWWPRLEDDDLGELVQPTGACGDGRAGGDAADDNEFHRPMICPVPYTPGGIPLQMPPLGIGSWFRVVAHG